MQRPMSPASAFVLLFLAFGVHCARSHTGRESEPKLSTSTPVSKYVSGRISGDDLEESEGTRRFLSDAADNGYWFAVGNQILDENGRVVKFSGVNWNGFDAENCVVDGLWIKSRQWFTYLDQMAEIGFNLIRLNFATTCLLDDSRMPGDGGINFNANPDLKGLTVLQIMDKVVAACKKRGIKIMLSNIRLSPATEASKYAADAGLWFNADHTELDWLNNWKKLALRYAGNPTVVGVDLYNEVHDDSTHENPVWAADGVGEPYNWRTAARRAADVIQSVNPNWLIGVQGMSQDSWWGANLQGIRANPLVLLVPNKLIYTIHDYGPLVYDQTWFRVTSFPLNMESYWNPMWAFVHNRNIAPIWVGEWGSKYELTSQDDQARRDVKWAEAFRDFVRSHQLSWTWFTWGPNSRDTGGILLDDWLTVHEKKLELLKPVMHPNFGASANQTLPRAPAHGKLSVVEAPPGPPPAPYDESSPTSDSPSFIPDLGGSASGRSVSISITVVATVAGLVVAFL